MAATAIPLAALRADLDTGWPWGLHWISAGGTGRAWLEQPVGSRLAFRLGPEAGTVRIGGRVALAAGGCGRTKVRVRVIRVGPEGGEKVLWKGSLRRFGLRHLPAARRVSASFEIPDGGTLAIVAEGVEEERIVWDGLQVSVEGGPPAAPSRDGATARAHRPVETPTAAADGPRFSVLTPVHDPPISVLEETIDSVRSQSFEDWELCLVDDGSTDPAVGESLSRAAAADPRVRHLRREEAGGIAEATNAALGMARGQYVALLDHDDLLLPGALEQVDAALRERPETDMLYSDEEVFEEDGESHAFTKPNWSPDLLRSQMYTCHLGVYRRSLAEEVGGFRSQLDGSQDYDFALRVTERTDRVLHIPRVLYGWRVHAGSSAGDAGAKPHAYPAARMAIAAHLARTGVDADVHFGPWQGIYRVVHRPPPGLDVAIAVVGERPGEALAAGLERERRADGLHIRVEAGATAAEAAAACEGAAAIVLCDARVEPLTRFWLTRLVGFAVQPGVAAVGALTVAPDGRVESGGVAIDDGLPLPMMFASGAGDPGPLGVGVLPSNVAAVSGVVAFGGGPFLTLGGLEPEAGGLAVEDYCLRALEEGMRIVSTPDVLFRRTSPPPVNELGSLAAFRERWRGRFPEDPYFDLDACWPGVEIRSG